MRDETARDALKALQEGKKIKLEYESPWYWLVSISGAERPAEAPKPRERKIRIQISPPTAPEPSYALDEQQDEEMRSGNDPILARAAAGNPSEFNMAVALGVEPEEMFDFPEEETKVADN
jgi:hypothetical protein